MTDPRVAVSGRNNLAVVFRGAWEVSRGGGQPRARMPANLGGLHVKLGNGAEAAAALRRSLEEMETPFPAVVREFSA